MLFRSVSQSRYGGVVEFAIPLHDKIDVATELTKLQAELTYQEGFLNAVLKKLIMSYNL